MIRKWLEYLDHDLWNFRLSQKTGWERFGLKWLRVFYLSIRGFFQDQCTLRASSLTYYTLISIVPVLAMTLAVASGFGLRDYFREQLLLKFRDQQEVFQQMIQFADQLLEQTRGGIIAGVGLLVLFWSVTSLLSSMEDALNQIWAVKRARSWKRVLSDYFAFLFLAPFLFAFSSGVTVFLATWLESVVVALPIGTFLISCLTFCLQLFPYALFWLLFTFIFLFIPNTKVSFRSAFVGGIVSGTLYVLVQWGYIFFQVGVSRYGAIYGSFAALPLFLIWVQLSWFLVLFGAEMSFAHQTMDAHEFEGVVEEMSPHLRRLLSLWVTYLVVRCYVKREEPLTKEALIHRYQVPQKVVELIVGELVRCKILLEVGLEKEYVGLIPARSPDELKVADVYEALDSHGIREWPWIESKAWKQIETTLETFHHLLEKSPDNQRLRDYDYE